MGIGVLAPTQLPAQSRKAGYDKELRMKSLLESIYTDLKGHYNTEKKSIPNAIYMTVDEAALSETNTATITMKLKLTAAGVMGNAVAIGSEELPVTKATTIFRNNCRKVIAKPGYGVRKLDADYLKLYEQHVDDLADWNKEEEDLEIHQALLETYGETLIWGDTAAACVRNWNPNIFVCGLPIYGGHPTYSTNAATYTNNIVTSILASGNGSFSPIPNQTLNAPNLSNLSNYALQKRIARLNIPGLPGGRGFILTFSELQAVYLGDPVWSARNLGALYIQKASLPEKVQNWTGVLGAYKDLLLVQDMRAATVLPGGSSEPYSLTAGYMWHGDTDERNRDNPYVRDVATLHGRGAVCNWYPEKLHMIDQKDDYGAIVGVGSALVRGIQIPVFNQQVPGTGTHEQFTSIEVLCGIPEYV